MTRLLLPLAILVLMIGLAACGDDNGGASPTATTGGPTATAAAGEPTATPGGDGTAEAPFEGGQDPVEGTLGTPGTPPPVGVVDDVRIGGHTDFDRITFEFADTGSTYTVEYVTDPTACGSGEPVDVTGPAFLQINLYPAQAHNDAGETTIDATDLNPGLPAIAGAVQSCDFEGYVTWILGLPAQLDFRVTTLADPLRLAVDVGHP